MYIIGLTGGIACGKSSVANELRYKHGAMTFDIDSETHKLLQSGGVLFETYVQHFDKQIVGADGELDRKLIGEIIFSDETERQWINSVAHPILLNRTRDFLVQACELGKELVVLEIPLLFEVGWEFLVDETWAVYVYRSLQVLRLTQRDQLTEEQALARINSQMPLREMCARADVVINNSGESNRLTQQVRKAIQNLGRKFNYE